MISILPEHAPPVVSHDNLKLLVAGSVIMNIMGNVTEAHIDEIASEIIYEVIQMWSTGESLVNLSGFEVAVELITITESDEKTINQHFTTILRHKLLHKFNTIYNK